MISSMRKQKLEKTKYQCLLLYDKKFLRGDSDEL